MSAAIKPVLTLNKIIVKIKPRIIPASTKPAPTLNQIIAKQAKLQGRTQEQLKHIVAEVAAGYDAFDPLFMFALRTEWMDKAHDPVAVLEASPELKADPERESRLRTAFKAELSRDNPWRNELPIKPFWYLLGGLDWAEDALLAFSISVAEKQAKRINNGYVLAVEATKNPFIEPSGLPAYKPTNVQRTRKRNDSTIGAVYSGMESFEGKWVTIVDTHYGVQEASKIMYAGEPMFNRDKIAGEVCMAIPAYNAPACKSCMKRFGRKQNPRKGEYLPVGVTYPCPDCGVNGDFDDPGMTYNDTQASYASVRRRFEETVQNLGLTTFNWTWWSIDDGSTELYQGTQRLWLVRDKKGTILKRWKSEVRYGIVSTVRFPKPKRDWGAWQSQMKEHKLDDIVTLGCGTMKGGQPSAFMVYVAEAWQLDKPWKIKAKEHWGSVPRGEDTDVMFPVKEKVDKLLYEPNPELPAWDDPDGIKVT